LNFPIPQSQWYSTAFTHIQVSGEISYNGYKLDEFVPQKSSAYISQYDLHVPEMTVRETIDFSARCQGVGSRAGEASYLLNPRLFHKIVINTLLLGIHI